MLLSSCSAKDQLWNRLQSQERENSSVEKWNSEREKWAEGTKKGNEKDSWVREAKETERKSQMEKQTNSFFFGYGLGIPAPQKNYHFQIWFIFYFKLEGKVRKTKEMHNGTYIVVLTTHLPTWLAPSTNSDRINTFHQNVTVHWTVTLLEILCPAVIAFLSCMDTQGYLGFKNSNTIWYASAHNFSV